MTEKKIKPSDLEKIAEQMTADGTMPPLEKVLQAVGEVRTKYCPLSRGCKDDCRPNRYH